MLLKKNEINLFVFSFLFFPIFIYREQQKGKVLKCNNLVFFFIEIQKFI